MSGGSSFFFTTDMTREESPLEIRPKYLVRGGFGTRSSRNSRASRKWTSKKWILDCTRLAHVTTCLREQPFRSLFFFFFESDPSVAEATPVIPAQVLVVYMRLTIRLGL